MLTVGYTGFSKHLHMDKIGCCWIAIEHIPDVKIFLMNHSFRTSWTFWNFSFFRASATSLDTA